MVKEEWIQTPQVEADVLSFVMAVRDQMELAKEVLKQNAKLARTKLKEYYDQKVKKIELNVGDQCCYYS